MTYRNSEPKGSFSILGDEGDDVSVSKIVSTGKDGTVVIFSAQIGAEGGDPFIWKGYDFGVRPYYGFGRTAEEAIIDAVKMVNSQIKRDAGYPVRLPEPPVKEDKNEHRTRNKYRSLIRRGYTNLIRQRDKLKVAVRSAGRKPGNLRG